jgi:hypothetical protein
MLVSPELWRENDPAAASLRKRARARYLSVPLSVTLAKLRSPLELSYRNTFYCASTLEQADGKLTTRYCGNRWCAVCNRIRTGRAINAYGPELEAWTRKHFVTLTVPNVSAGELPAAVRGMIRTFQAVKLAMRRTDKVKLVALRKYECTYNARRDDFHPHFHIVVETPEMARLLLARWLEAYPEARGIAQNVKPINDDGLRELFKYFTKLVTKTRGKKNEAGRSRPVNPVALDIIFRSMKGLRVYQPVGFTIAKEKPDADAATLEPSEATTAICRVTERVVWEWSQAVADWIAADTGETLTGYEPGERFAQFVAAIADDQPAPVGGMFREMNRGALYHIARESLRNYARDRDYPTDSGGR